MKALLRRMLSLETRRRLRAALARPRLAWRLRCNFADDRRRFARWSSACSGPFERIQMAAWIDGDRHKIEKALALPEPRPGFGLAVAARLIELIERYRQRWGEDGTTAAAAGALVAYRDFQRRHDALDPSLASLDGLQDEAVAVHEIEGEAIRARGQRGLEDFFTSRHSVRNFADLPVDRADVERAVALARYAPSVCNRQSWRVHAFDRREDVDAVLATQSGNKGFGHTVPTVLVVTTDLRTFFSVGERYQCWIDGGMFAMALVYALHSLGLATCCLNWSVERKQDRLLHRRAGIPPHERVIVQIAVGQLPDRLAVAHSQRLGVDEIMTWKRTDR